MGDLEIANLTAAAAFEHTVDRLKSMSNPIEALLVAISMKESATTASVDVVDHAVAVVGGWSVGGPFTAGDLADLAPAVGAEMLPVPAGVGSATTPETIAR